jgi:Type I restriction enzyme R protein N terminus (HSDR_N)
VIADLETLQHWLTDYDPSTLHNEDDVETRFVLPLFRLLRYPESHRRGKYPISIHEGRKGRKHEVDQVYFASGELRQQILGRALVLVEAKRADEGELDEAIAQAQSYGERLRPLLLVVTNGRRILILRRRRFDPDETVLDSPVQELANIGGVQRLAALLSFDSVLGQHEQLIDDLAHEQFVRLEQALRAYPDIQKILLQSDFVEAETREGRALRVARAKVQIEGKLPICLGGGSCEITFSHILRRGLRIHLDHAGILSTLMVGIGSDPSWDTRHFIERETEDAYRVRLGDMETQLSHREAQDLCACVDRFAGVYREAMMRAEDALAAWVFPIASFEGDLAFYLTSVDASFWKHVRHFADEHDRRSVEKDQEWSRFEFWRPGFRIGHERGDHAWIATINELGFGVPTGLDLRHLVYVLPDGQPLLDLDVGAEDWQQNLGTNGQWTVQETDQWLSEHLLPEVERRCRAHPEQLNGRVLFGQIRRSPNSQHYSWKEPVEHAGQLVPNLEDVQRWLNRYSARMLQASLIAKPYRSLLDLTRTADPAQLDLHYVTSNMASITSDTEFPENSTPAERLRDYLQRGELVVNFLDRAQTVSPRLLDRVARSFYAVLRDAKIGVAQSTLNHTWAALQPLWRLAQFEQRHVWPYMDGHRGSRIHRL